MKAQIQEEQVGVSQEAWEPPQVHWNNWVSTFQRKGTVATESPSQWKARLSCTRLPCPGEPSVLVGRFFGGCLGEHSMPPCPGLNVVSQKLMATWNLRM